MQVHAAAVVGGDETYRIWCAQPGSNRHDRSRGIFLPLRLSPPSGRCSWSGLCLDRNRTGHSRAALGRRRQVSARSLRPRCSAARASLSVASPGRAGGSLNLTPFTRTLSPSGAQVSSPLRLPVSPWARRRILACVRGAVCALKSMPGASVKPHIASTPCFVSPTPRRIHLPHSS